MENIGEAQGSRLWTLYQEHESSALRFAYLATGNADLAEDLVQEAFARVAGRFLDLRRPEAFGQYLRTTILNLARDHFRRKRLERHAFSEQKRLQERKLKASVTAAHAGTGADEIWDALDGLPHRQRAALVLRFYEDLSEAQSAELLGCSIGALKSLVARGMLTIRTRLELEND